jgi:hypothetical protein
MSVRAIAKAQELPPCMFGHAQVEACFPVHSDTQLAGILLHILLFLHLDNLTSRLVSLSLSLVE